jgi:drug/metabolite transporter (DMT)-like permease
MLAALIFGLTSALFYGATDFLAGYASRRGGVVPTMVYGQAAAAALFTILLAIHGVPLASARDWALLLATDVINLAGTVMLYRAMAIGRLTVVAPLVASYGAVGVLLSAIAGDAMQPAHWGGLVMVCIGAVLAAKPAPRVTADEPPSAPAIAYALIASLFYGIGFWVQGRLVVPVLGVIAPVWSYYLLGAVAAPIVALVRGISLAVPPPRLLGAMLATAALGGLGYVTLSAGQATGAVAVVTALSALASGVTVLLARAFLAEQIGSGGWAGVALVLTGLALLQF